MQYAAFSLLYHPADYAQAKRQHKVNAVRILSAVVVGLFGLQLGLANQPTAIELANPAYIIININTIKIQNID